MSSFSRSGILLCVFLLLGTCIGIVIARESKTENNKEWFGTSSIRILPRWRWHHHHAPSLGWWWRTHPKKTSPTHVSPSPSPVDNAASPTHASPSPVDDEVSRQHTTPAPTPMTSCINVDGCKSDLITSIFKCKILLTTQCCKVLSTISDDCFYKEFSYSKRVPFFLGKVSNYCSHAIHNATTPTHAVPSLIDNATTPTHAVPSLIDNVASPTHAVPSPIDNVASPTHAVPSPIDNVASPTHAASSPADNVASPSHAAPSPSSVDDVVSPPHTAPSLALAPTPTPSCIKVDGCALNLITSVFKRKISLSTQCCQVLSIISDDCFYREFTHSERVPFFLGKVRNYCSHHQG